MKQAEIISPKSSQNLFGHEKVYNQLLNAYASGCMHHAWLISGKKGIGKATLIYNFIKRLLTTDNNYQQIHNRIISQSHPDLLVIERKEGEKDIAVDEVRKISSFLRLTPAESKYRIVIIDECDYLNKNSANALLKILEEPPKNSFIFLISNKTGNLPVTIISRCRRLRINDLSAENAFKVVNAINDSLTEAVINKLLILADYSPAIALELAEVNGLEIYAELIDIIKQSPNLLELKRINNLADSLQAASNPWQLFIFLLNHFLFKLIKTASIIEQPLFIVETEQEIIKQFLSATNITDCLELWENIQNLANETEKANLDQKQTMLVIFDLIKETIKD